MTTADPITVSVVLIGRNEGPRLLACIDSLHNTPTDGLALDVLYVDSNSTDNSVADAQARGLRTLVLPAGTRPTAAVGRNLGWRASTAEFILFLDGDTLLDPTFLNRALTALQQSPTNAAVCAERHEIYPTATIYNRVFDLDWNGPPGEVDYVGGDALFRRAALEAANGYDDTLIGGEEPELCTRLRLAGWTILRIPGPMTMHDLAMHSFLKYWKRQIRTGYAYAQVSARFKDTAQPLWIKQSRANVLRAGTLIVAALIALGLTLWIHSITPLLLFVTLFLLLAVRTAAKTLQSGRTSNGTTAILYGLHSHIQQLPILQGQLQFWTKK